MDKRVIITDPRTREARDAAAYLREQGYEVIQVPESVRLWREEELRAWADTVSGGLTGVIHPLPPPFLSPLLETTEEEYARARNEGPLAAWCVTKVLGERMASQGDGSLIYLGSVHAEKPAGQGFLFSSAAAAVQMLNREVNQDLGTRGVRSFYIQRGPSRTDPEMGNDLTPFFRGMEKKYPRRAMPENGALNGLLTFLLTPAAAPLAGSDLRADGGMTMYYGERITEEQLQEYRKQMLLGKEVSILGDE